MIKLQLFKESRDSARTSQIYQSPEKTTRQKSTSLNRGKSLENYEKLNGLDQSSCPCCEKYKNLEDLNEVLKYSSLRLQKLPNYQKHRRSIIKPATESSQYYYQPHVQFDVDKDQLKNNPNLTTYSGTPSEDTTLSEQETSSEKIYSKATPNESNPWIKRMNEHRDHPDAYKPQFSKQVSYYDFNNPSQGLNDSDYFKNSQSQNSTNLQSNLSGLKVRFFKS